MVTRAAISRLTARELQIIELVMQGASNAEVAERLSLKVQTVKNRLCEIYSKLGVDSRTELVAALLRLRALER